MAFITDEQAAALDGADLYLATLVELQLVSETMRLWNGHGTLDVAGGEWRGVGEGGGIEGIGQSRDAQSALVTLSLSGVSPAVLALALAEQSEVAGRPAYIWQQLFTSQWAPLGARIPLWWGIMQRTPIDRAPASDTSGGSRIVKLEIESPFAARSHPANGRYTDADHQARYPGDLFCDQIATQRMQTVIWPKY